MGFAGAAKAATVNDIAVCKHSYVFVCDDVTNNGTVKPDKNTLVGNGFILLFGSDAQKTVATNKGSVDLSAADGEIVTEEIAEKYGEYGSHLNSLRLKNLQDMFVMKLTAKSKLIIFYNGQGKEGASARMPRVATDEKLENSLNPAPTAETGKVGVSRMEIVIPDDGTYYVGSYNGDIYFSYIIVEANEAPGTPTVKVGDQTFADGLWFREVTCKAVPATEEGSTEKIPTLVTYTTDGTMPTAASPVYTAPIKCYQNMTVKFQAFLDFGDGKPSADFICDGADNEANVNFMFDAPTIESDGPKVTITSPYEGQGAINFYNIGETDVEDSELTLTESATVTAYTKIENGNYGSFKSNSTSKDVYVLNPIKEKKTITVSGSAVVDEEATAEATDGKTHYKIENGVINYDKMDFFIKSPVISAVAGDNAQYQIDGQEAYIQMSNTNITFLMAAGDKAKVKVICSKNSCKNIDADDAEDGSQVNDRKCVITVNGTNYTHLNEDGGEMSDMKLFPNEANIVEFELQAGKTVKQNVKDADGNDVLDEDGKAVQEEVFSPEDTYFTFQKYSGTGAIYIQSIEITPEADPAGIKTIDTQNTVKAVRYNLAGQKVSKNFKGIVIENGKKFMMK